MKKSPSKLAFRKRQNVETLISAYYTAHRKEKQVESKQYNAEVIEVGNEFYKLASTIGITHALGCIFGNNVEMSLPIPKEVLDANIRLIDLPARARSSVNKWCAMNAEKPQTIARVVEMIERSNEIRQFIAGYGKKTEDLIKQRIMEAVWDVMTEEQRRAFSVHLIDRNCYYAEGDDGEAIS